MIARYVFVDCCPDSCEMERDDKFGSYVTYSDHLAVLAAARREERERVAAHFDSIQRTAIAAAIRALGEEPKS